MASTNHWIPLSWTPWASLQSFSMSISCFRFLSNSGEDNSSVNTWPHTLWTERPSRRSSIWVVDSPNSSKNFLLSSLLTSLLNLLTLSFLSLADESWSCKIRSRKRIITWPATLFYPNEQMSVAQQHYGALRIFVLHIPNLYQVS